MKLSFKRIITSGKFIPEIDGLRFLAITSVLLFHIYGFLKEKDLNQYNTETSFDFFNNMLSNGGHGVQLFFVISAFILGRPFANAYLKNKPNVSLSKYFTRRLTRLEPPYIIIMTMSLLSMTFVLNKISFENAIYSYICSIFYIHNFIYGNEVLPILNAVAWSLEVEVQFYILMPVLALLFRLRNSKFRRILFIILSILFIIFDYIELLPFRSILNYFEYFWIGLLLSDLYVSNSALDKAPKFSGFISIILLVVIFQFSISDFNSILAKITWEIIQLSCIFILYYLVIFHKSLKILSTSLITNIGGMCYTIYLIHYFVISFLGNPLVKLKISDMSIVNTTFYFIILISSVLVVSSVYFLAIERPCMDKNWYKKLYAQIISIIFVKQQKTRS